MASGSKGKVRDKICESAQDNYAFDHSPSTISYEARVNDGAVRFDQRGFPADSEQYAIWRRGIRKLDWRALPPLTLLWWADFVDRVS